MEPKISSSSPLTAFKILEQLSNGRPDSIRGIACFDFMMEVQLPVSINPWKNFLSTWILIMGHPVIVRVSQAAVLRTATTGTLALGVGGSRVENFGYYCNFGCQKEENILVSHPLRNNQMVDASSFVDMVWLLKPPQLLKGSFVRSVRTLGSHNSAGLFAFGPDCMAVVFFRQP